MRSVLSINLFTLYGEKVIKEVEDIEENAVCGRTVKYIMYADDSVLLVDSEENLQTLADRMQECCKRKREGVSKLVLIQSIQWW